MKDCCAEVILGPKFSVDQNKSQGIQKFDLKAFQIYSAITMRSITTWKIQFYVKILKVEAAGKYFKFRLFTLLQMGSAKCFLRQNAFLFHMTFIRFVIATNHIFEKVLHF